MVFGFLGSKYTGHDNKFFNEYYAAIASGTYYDVTCIVTGDKRGVEQAGVEDSRQGARVTTFRDGRCAL